MDSLYDAPRRPPEPPLITNVMHTPSVPEVSLIENSFLGGLKPSKQYDLTKDSFLSMTRKQVRFEKPKSNKENVPDLRGKTFKQIYMANVPDAQLDLSVFENFRTPTATQNFVKQQPVLNSIENEIPIGRRQMEQQQACTEVAKPDDEPTIKDLFRVIQQQNEQIMLLQQQVNSLKSSIRPPEVFHPPNLNMSPTKKGVISIIDVKTANFEVLYHPHKNRKSEATIQEIVDCDREDYNHHHSNLLRFDRPVEVEQKSMSSTTPNPDISFNGLPEYESSEDEDEETSGFGTTLYHGLMNQINNALRLTSECPKSEVTGQTIKQVKQATLQHLKTMGVNLSPIQESNEITGGSEIEPDTYDKEDVSFAVQQLLMKYLPDDKLTKALMKKRDKLPKPVVRNKKSTELSFETLQYLKKYNIIAEKSKKLNGEPKTTPPRFLDITALKLQKKLPSNNH